MGKAVGAHRVHGMGTALEAPTWPAITAGEARAILRAFPSAGRLIAMRWHSPRPFSAAVLVETSAGGFLIKRHDRRVRTPRALAQEHAFMAHLRAAGVAVPAVIPASDGSGAIVHGTWTCEVHAQAPGADLYRDRPSWTPFLSHDHAHAAGVALARLHRAAQSFAAPPRDAQPLVASLTILPARDPLAAAQAYIAARPALATVLADVPWRAELARLFAAHGSGLSERLARQPGMWTHNDWHPSNLLWSPDGTVGTVIDFGLSTRTCALHDLATAIERTAFGWLHPGEAMIADPGAALALIAGYRMHVALGRDDLATLIGLLPLAHIEFALSEIEYFAGVVGDCDAARHAWQGYLIDHADWFGAAPGRDFLRALERGAGA